MKKRIISLLMALLMLTSLLPTAVWAQGDTPDQTAVPVINDGASGQEQEPAAETPEEPEEPGEPEQPAAPEIPETPETPATPEEPEVPAVPQTPADETQGEDEGIRVEASSGKCGNSVYWSLDGGTLTISGNGEMWNYDYPPDDDGPTNPWWYTDWFVSRIYNIVVEEGVTYIGDYAFCCNRAVNISIASSVKEIGSYSFSGCRGTTSITLPDGLQRIDDCAFRGFGDETLQTINIPSSVTYIGEAAFWQSGALTAINFDGTVDQWIDRGGGMSLFSRSVTLTCKGGGSMVRSGVCKDGLKWELDDSGTLTISGNGKMDDYYYVDNTPTAPWANLWSMIRSVKIGSGVTSIGAWAFEETNINTLSIPSSVKTIGHGAFYRNAYLSSVSLARGTEVIDREAFSYCIRLSSVSIPDTVTEIGRKAFYSCYNMYSQNGMHKTGLTSITIPASVMHIGENVFTGCYLLKTVNFQGSQAQWSIIGGEDAGVPDTATINYGGAGIPNGMCGDSAFWVLSGSTLTIGGSGAMYDYPTGVGDNWQTDWKLPWKNYAKTISRIVVGEGITSIGAYAFCYLENAAEVSLPSTLTAIGEGAFWNIAAASLVIPDTVATIGDFAFNGCVNLETITLPAGLQEIGPCFTDSSNLNTINFKGTMEQWLACGGGASTFPAQTQVVCASGTLSRNGKCGDNLTWRLDNSGTLTIFGNGEMADYYYDDTPTVPWAKYRSMIRSVVIGSGVTYIGAWAFEDTNITSLTIPGSVKTIGDGSFFLNRYLAKLTLNSGLETICPYAFSYCRIGSVDIPDGVTSIGEEAFSYCARSDYRNGGWVHSWLTSITIPASVTSIGKDMLKTYDDYVLPTVNFNGTQEQWNAIGGKDSGMPDTATINYVTVVGSGSCGAGVTWSLTSTGVLTIGGSGAVTQIPWQQKEVTEVVVFEGVTSLCDHAFTRQPITRVTLPDSLTAIGTMAFAGCQMEELCLPRNLKTVGVEAFTGCAELKYLDMDKNCAVTLGDMAFKLCTALEAVHLSANIKLGEGVFAGCSNLEEVLFEGSGKQWLSLRSGIDEGVALECRGGGFGSGKCGDNLTWELDGSGLLTISGTGAMYDYQDTLDATKEGKNSPWTVADGTYLFWYVYEIKINYGVTHIGDTAFKYCLFVNDITIPGSVTSIGESAFRNCENLRNVTIPNTVTSIGANAFLNDDRLSAIYFSGTAEQWAALSQDIGLSSNVAIEYVKLGIITSGSTEPNVGDMQALYEGLTGQKDLIYKQQKAADVNQDGEIDVYDLQRLYEAVNQINRL